MCIHVCMTLCVCVGGACLCVGARARERERVCVRTCMRFGSEHSELLEQDSLKSITSSLKLKIAPIFFYPLSHTYH